MPIYHGIIYALVSRDTVGSKHAVPLLTAFILTLKQVFSTLNDLLVQLL